MGGGGGTVSQIVIRVPCTDFKTEKIHSGARPISERLEDLTTELLCEVCGTCCSRKLL